jgi:hypothetical protein
MGSVPALERSSAAGRLNARERVAVLLDPGSFVEMGVLAQPAYACRKDPGRRPGGGAWTIDGRLVYVMSEELHRRRRDARADCQAKSARIREAAFRHSRPLIILMEAGAEAFQENNGNGGRHREPVPRALPAVGLGTADRRGGRLLRRADLHGDAVGLRLDRPRQRSRHVRSAGGQVGNGRTTMEEIGGADKSGRETGQADYIAPTAIATASSTSANSCRTCRRTAYELPPRGPERRGRHRKGVQNCCAWSRTASAGCTRWNRSCGCWSTTRSSSTTGSATRRT